MAILDESGNISEPTSKNYGKPPDPDTARERTLLRWGWLWLLIPIAGVIPFVGVQKELTDRWGHPPWWE